MTIGEAIVLGGLQGLTEFLPISSSGHLILARELFGIGEGSGLAFDALLHFATALAVVVYFRQDILDIVVGTLLYIKTRRLGAAAAQTALAIVVGTIPAVVLGFFLEEVMETAFRNASLVAGSLVVGSLIMYIAERTLMRRTAIASDAISSGSPTPESESDNESNKSKPNDGHPMSVIGSFSSVPSFSTISTGTGVVVGLFQALALVPGMSRSGMALSGGIFAGLSRVEAARFAFLLSVPVLLGGGAKKMLDLFAGGAAQHDVVMLAAGVAAAFATGLGVIHWLLQYLRARSLMPFIWYRIVLAGVIALYAQLYT